MSAPAYTKGPWREGIDGNNRVYGPNCAGEHTGLIAVVYKGRANIRLIAAAPELYEAAVLAREALGDPIVGTIHHDEPYWYRKVDEALAAIDAALARARGEQQ